MVLLTTVVFVVALGPAARGQSPVKLIPLIEEYFQGRRDEAIQKAAAITDLGSLRLQFVQQTPVWVNADPPSRGPRSAAVAAFLIELTAARLESDWGRFSDLIEWTCVQLRTAGPPTEFEHAWHAASHALAGRARSRVWLLGEFAVLPHQKPFNRPPSDPQHPPARHLIHALERFPDDPQFQLSRIVAWTWSRDAEPIRNVETRVREVLNDAVRSTRRPAQLEAVVALEPLTSIPVVAAEAWVRTGIMHFVVNDFTSALKDFENAQATATEPAMKYIAFLNAGRTLEALSRQDDAIRAYQRALEIVPFAESATVALTSLQFMGDDREAAVTMIEKVFNKPPSATDPGRLIGYGSYLRWPQLKDAIRNALSSYPPGAK